MRTIFDKESSSGNDQHPDWTDAALLWVDEIELSDRFSKIFTHFFVAGDYDYYSLFLTNVCEDAGITGENLSFAYISSEDEDLTRILHDSYEAIESLPGSRVLLLVRGFEQSKGVRTKSRFNIASNRAAHDWEQHLDNEMIVQKYKALGKHVVIVTAMEQTNANLYEAAKRSVDKSELNRVQLIEISHTTVWANQVGYE